MVSRISLAALVLTQRKPNIRAGACNKIGRQSSSLDSQSKSKGRVMKAKPYKRKVLSRCDQVGTLPSKTIVPLFSIPSSPKWRSPMSQDGTKFLWYTLDMRIISLPDAIPNRCCVLKL